MSGRAGRPRDGELDTALASAVSDLLLERGYGRITVDAVASRAGTNKNAFYRRYRDLAEAASAVIAGRFGADFDVDTGSVDGDVRFMTTRLAQFFTDPLMSNSGPGFLEEMRTNPVLAGVFTAAFMKPRRATVRKVIARAVSRGEIPARADHEWITDLMIGPFFVRALVPGTPAIDEAMAEHAAVTVLGTLGYERPSDEEKEFT